MVVSLWEWHRINNWQCITPTPPPKTHKCTLAQLTESLEYAAVGWHFWINAHDVTGFPPKWKSVKMQSLVGKATWTRIQRGNDSWNQLKPCVEKWHFFFFWVCVCRQKMAFGRNVFFCFVLGVFCWVFLCRRLWSLWLEKDPSNLRWLFLSPLGEAPSMIGWQVSLKNIHHFFLLGGLFLSNGYLKCSFHVF